MTTSESIDKIKNSYFSFIEHIDSLSEQEFLYAENETWSAGQQLEHIVKSVVPLNTYMALPSIAKKLMFGTNKNHSKSYDDIVEKYVELIKSGGKAPKAYEPKTIPFSSKEQLISKLNYNLNKFLNSVVATKETDLDKFRIPHPLLGILSLREMLYFTDYHVIHHHQSIINKLKT